MPLVLAQSWSNLSQGEIEPSGLASVLPSSALALLPISYGPPTSEIHQSPAELTQAQQKLQGDNKELLPLPSLASHHSLPLS